jgi:hypothetical protein
MQKFSEKASKIKKTAKKLSFQFFGSIQSFLFCGINGVTVHGGRPSSAPHWQGGEATFSKLNFMALVIIFPFII